METKQGSGSNVKHGGGRRGGGGRWRGSDRCDGSTTDSNGCLGLDAASKFALYTLLERITLECADCTNNGG